MVHTGEVSGDASGVVSNIVFSTGGGFVGSVGPGPIADSYTINASGTKLEVQLSKILLLKGRTTFPERLRVEIALSAKS